MTGTAIKRFLYILIGTKGQYIIDYPKQVSVPYVHQTLIRLLLSDGNLHKYSETSASLLCVAFGINNTSYLLHIYNIQERYVNTAPYINSVFNKIINSYNMLIKFKTPYLSVFLPYLKMFQSKDAIKRTGLIKIFPLEKN